MSRIPEVSLADVWNNANLREQVHAGQVNIKLPIEEADFPLTRTMRQISISRVPLMGRSGYSEMWVFNNTIVFRMSCGAHDHLWGVRFSKPEEALHVFGRQAARNDELLLAVRDHRLTFSEGDEVEVATLDHHFSVEAFFHPIYRANRAEGAVGVVVCKVDTDSAWGDYWLVRHDAVHPYQITSASFAVYHEFELKKLRR